MGFNILMRKYSYLSMEAVYVLLEQFSSLNVEHSMVFRAGKISLGESLPATKI
jgi:hypothetical protein